MAWNICDFLRTFLVVLSISILFGKVTADMDQCGSLEIEQPTILGRNVTFTFTPETTSNAVVKWHSTRSPRKWSTLHNDQKFTQYYRDGSYYLILTNAVKYNDEVIYRVAYKNNSVSCFMETERLKLKGIPVKSCGFVYLRTTKVKEGENVKIEYYPSKYVLDNQEQFVREWKHSTQIQTTPITLMKGVYEEKWEPKDKYVLTIFVFKEQMNGRYLVRCGGNKGYSNMVDVILPVPPSAPVFDGLMDIDDCKGCIVGEDGDKFSVLCKTSGGTQPVIVTMAIGNVSLSSARYNDTAAGYLAYFTLLNRHHMATMKCTALNDALESPLIVTARVYVIKPPSMLPFTVPQTLKEGNIGNITCILDSGRPVPNVTVTISGIEKPAAVNFHSFHANTSLYTTVVSLTTFERTWNNENVKCCRFNQWYKTKSVCSVPKLLNIIFPPRDIKLEVKVEQNPPYNMYAVCTIYDSNPVCKTNISAPNGIIGSERYSTNTVDQAHGAWNSVHAVDLNVVKDGNGKKIECTADCENFSVDLKDIQQITLPHKDAQQHKDMDNSISGDKLLIWIILGSCLFVLFLVVIVTVCLIARKRKRNNKVKLETNQVRSSADGASRDKEDNLEGDPRGNLNDGAQAFDDTEVTYSQPVKNKPASNADATYSTVNKTRKSNAVASCSKKNEEGQLLYADLDFDSNDAPLKGAAAKRRDSPTEYVAIDFVKTATGITDENKPPETDNIYANQ